MEVTVRRARPEELAAVGELTVAAYGADDAAVLESPYAGRLLDAASRARDAVLLVGVGPDGALVGTVTYVRPGTAFAEVGGPDEAEVRMLAVPVHTRRAGVGRLLADACVALAREEGCAALVLSSGSWMTAAHRLYERMGFVRTPERDWSPRSGIELVTYRLAL